MAKAIVSAWTSRPTHLIVGPVRDVLTRLSRLLTSRRGPSNHNPVALGSAWADPNPRKRNASPTLSQSLRSHTV